MIRLKQEKSMSPEDEKKLARSATIQNVVIFGVLCGIIRAGGFYLLDVLGLCQFGFEKGGWGFTLIYPSSSGCK